jgi:Holliday junction resolvase RusA-like endonuclease
MTRITLPGNPIPMARSRTYRVKGKSITYNPQKKEKTFAQLVAKSQVHSLMEGPIKMYIRFFMPIPKSTSKKTQEKMKSEIVFHCSKPDIDNLIKFVLDVLNNIGYKDDSQIVSLTTEKFYSPIPRTELWFNSVEDSQFSIHQSNHADM